MSTSSSRYSTVAIILHWVIAAAIVFQLGLGWRMGLQKGPAAFAAFQLHKSIGITILVLSLVRLAWRLTHHAPSHADQPRWEQLAATATHTFLYGIMIGLPLSGWVSVSTSKLDIPTLLYRVVPWPHVPGLATLPDATKAVWHDGARFSHSSLVWLTLVLLGLHLGAVFKHQIIDRDHVLAHMAPGATTKWSEPRLWLASIVAVLVFATGFGLWDTSKWPARQAVASGTLVPVSQPNAPEAEHSLQSNITLDTNAPTTPPAQWVITPDKSLLNFTALWVGQAIDGHFGKWNGEIVFSPDALSASHLRITIDIASAATGDAQRDASLPSAEWFDTTAHPGAVYTTDKITQTGNGQYHAIGTLDLRGIHKPLAIDFTVAIQGDHASAKGHAVIDRTLFGVGQGEWAATDQIAADVKVDFTLEATRH